MATLLLLIESNTSGTGRLFARAARTLGYDPLLVCRHPERYPYVAEDGVPTVVADTADELALRALARNLDLAEGIAGITSSSEYFVATAARLAWDLGLPAANPDAVASCRDKAFQRWRLAEAGVDRVRHAATADPAAAVLAARDLGFPVVLKPVAASGSVGVRLCSTPEVVAEHARTLLAGGGIDRILVEEAVAGAEYSVEVFHGAVVGITAKHLGALPHFVEMGHDFPAPLEADARSEIAGFALAAVQALGLTWGPVHVELRADGPQLHVMEVNPRLAGGYIPEMVRHATGIDLVLETVRLVTGGTPHLVPTRTDAAAIRFLDADQDGDWIGTEGLEAARNVRFVQDVRLYRTLPTAVARRGDFQDRLGHVLAAAPDLADAMTTAESARSAIRLRVTTPSAAVA